MWRVFWQYSLAYEGSHQEDLGGVSAFAGAGHRIRGGGVQAGLDEERKRELETLLATRSMPFGDEELPLALFIYMSGWDR